VTRARTMPRAEAVPLQEILLHVNVSDGLNDSVTADAGDLAAGGPTPSPDELEDDGELTITRSLSRTSITEEHSEYQLPRVVSWMNPYLSTLDGDSTLLFKGMTAVLVLDSAHFFGGTFMSPDIVAAVVDEGNPLLAVTCVGWGVGIMLAFPALAVFRREVLVTGATAKLVHAVHISSEKQKHLQKLVQTVQVAQSGFLLLATFGFGIVVIEGHGVHSPAYNRMSAMMQLLAWWFMVPVIASGFVQMNIATQTSTQAVSNVIGQLKAPPTASEAWSTRVAKPTVALSNEVMPTLSRFGTPLMATFATFWSYALGFFALALNPDIATLSQRIGLSWIPTVILIATCLLTAGVCAFIPMYICSAPASVSTLCGDLKNELNCVRLKDLCPETDARVCILERGLSNINHGQGIGFAFGRVVVDSAMLKELAVKLAGVLFTIVPLIWAWRAAGSGDLHPCTLTKDQGNAWQTFAAQFNSTCTYRYEIGPHGVTPLG
jgi:hypothetical protein